VRGVRIASQRREQMSRADEARQRAEPTTEADNGSRRREPTMETTRLRDGYRLRADPARMLDLLE